MGLCLKSYSIIPSLSFCRTRLAVQNKCYKKTNKKPTVVFVNGGENPNALFQQLGELLRGVNLSVCFSPALAMGLCVAMIAFVRLPSLKVSCLLLSGLLIYDVFWVFFSAYIFSSNVMVKVATQPADNPLDVLSRKLHLGPNVGRDVPRLSLPGKLVFPSSSGSHFSMLGIGDIVMPGLLLCFVLRYDNYKKQANGEVPGTPNTSGRMNKVSYFHCTLIGYFVGLLTATVASRIHRAAQPALLYLVPFTLLPLLTMAYLKGDLRRMWSEPFHSKASSSRFLEV
ncbi:signal peptide peptidase-like 3 [Polyodon spathula]|uniref:signal peptide peptidase-like 3 n=1 Tax=Polyodon spathula TaxID=7913 RepID=UPI001B7DF12C|nr:signal peptide peptidase-like 3 [Polyodon spathula]